MSAPTGRVTFCHILLFILLFQSVGCKLDDKKLKYYKQRVKDMFYHAYDSYLRYAYPYDELRPLTCDGHDTWGSYSLTLIDALDTLAIMGNYTEFRRVANVLLTSVDFDKDLNVSVFETNIRIVGGLLSAHLFSHKAGMVLEPGWPCSGPLLRMAEKIARKILPEGVKNFFGLGRLISAFDTPTGMPYGTVNLIKGVPEGETTVTCTAGVGTFLIEFGSLSRLTGDPIFEKTAIRALESLWRLRSEIGLVGNHIDVKTGKWTALDGGIGGGIDSYFEYLVKGGIMFQIPGLLDMFNSFSKSLEIYTKRDDWYMWAHMKKGSITLPMFTSLDAYWPGIQSLLGRIDEAMKTIHNFHQVWKQFGFTPEYYNIPKGEVHQGREGYPLRPELIESTMYLYKATKDPYLLEIGIDILESIEHTAKTSCGYATIKNVNDHRLENRMESFFLAETTKYLYLLFDTDNFIHNNGNHGTVIQTSSGECVIDAGGYIFNTEAHPIDIASLHCCSAQKTEDDKLIQGLHDDLDLLSVLGILDDGEKSKVRGNKWRKAPKRPHKKQGSYSRNEIDIDDASAGENMKNNIEVIILDGNGKPISTKFEGSLPVSKLDTSASNKVNDVALPPLIDGKDQISVQSDKGSFQSIQKTSVSSQEENMKSDSPDPDLIDVKQKIASGLEKLSTNESEFVQVLNSELQKTINTLLDSLEKQIKSENKVNAVVGDKDDEKNFDKHQESSEQDKPDKNMKERLQANLDKIVSNFKKLEVAGDENLKKLMGSLMAKDLKSINENIPESKSSTGSENEISKTLASNEGTINDGVNKIGETANVEGAVNLNSFSMEAENNEQSVISNKKKDSRAENKDNMDDSKSTKSQGRQAKELNLHHSQRAPDTKSDINSLDQTQKQSRPLTPKIFTLDNLNLNSFSFENTILDLFSKAKFNLFGAKAPTHPSISNLYQTLENYSINYTVNPEVFHCPAQPFHMRLSVYGEMFVEPKDYS